MSWWSPNIDKAWVARLLAATWITAGNISPAILYILGIINKSPWLAVNVDAKEPDKSAPCRAPAAPASECGCCDVLENTKKFVENLHNAGILSDENYNGFQSIFEGGDVPSVATGYSNSDIDEMYGDWMKK